MSDDGNRIFVGEPGYSAARLFEYSEPEKKWRMLIDLQGGVDWASGTSVALTRDGTKVGLGAPEWGDDQLGDEVGFVAVYDVSTCEL